MRLLSFVLALLLLAGTVDPTQGWLITLTVITGIEAFRPRFWNPLDLRPALDMRLGAFVLSVLLLAGTVDPTRDWLIALAAVTGLAAFMPRVLSLDRPRTRGWWRYGGDWSWIEPSEWTGRHWRRRHRAFDPFGDEWR